MAEAILPDFLSNAVLLDSGWLQDRSPDPSDQPLNGEQKNMNIPSDIDDVYQELKTEVVWLHGRWILYRQLFGESQRRFDLLNECASTFFYVIQDVLFGEVQVTLSKLTDPARLGTNENLSLEQLQERLTKHGDGSLAARNQALLKDLKLKCKPFRKWRNKRLAHLDLTAAMKSVPNPLPGISRAMIEDALKTLRQYMNNIEGHYLDSEVGYEHFMMNTDGEALVTFLKYGLRYAELQRSGTVGFDDWRRGQWHDA